MCHSFVTLIIKHDFIEPRHLGYLISTQLFQQNYLLDGRVNIDDIYNDSIMSQCPI